MGSSKPVDMICDMCGRYLMTSDSELLMDIFELDERPDVHPTWNAAPTQQLPVVRVMEGRRCLDHLRWGLVPAWSKDLGIGARMINARSETAAEKPSFRKPLCQRRCLVVADGFYEWQRDGSSKRPFCIRLKNGNPFGMGGLWERWTGPDGVTVDSFSILTTSPNELMSPIHDRMPVIIHRDQHERWLAPDLQDPGQVSCLMHPFDSDQLVAHEVSSYVNSARHDDENCIKPA